MTFSKYMLVHTPALDDAKKVVPKAMREKADALRTSKTGPARIGLWDLGAWLGGLAQLIEAMNRAQTAFVFFETKATVPVGLVSLPKRLVPWLTDELGRKLSVSEKREIVKNLIANDYFELAEGVRQDLKIDYIVGITPSMVAGKDEDGVYWNHFSTFERRTILVSTYQLREFAKMSGRPFEAFLAAIIIPQLFVAKFYPKLGFHDPNRGCLYDYNADRISLIDKVLDTKIESECLKVMPLRYRSSAQSLVGLLSRFART